MSSQYNVSIRHNVQTPYYRAERYNEVLLYILDVVGVVLGIYILISPEAGPKILEKL